MRAQIKFSKQLFLASICLFSAFIFLVCIAWAMNHYHGGTWFDERTVGHSFWQNFLCDLFQHRALDGTPNKPVAQVASVGMFAMLVGQGAFFYLISCTLGAPRRAALLTKWFGVSAAILGVAIPLTPSDANRTVHLTAVVVAFVPALIATLAACLVCVRSGLANAMLRVVSFLTLLFAFSDGLLYAIAFSVTEAPLWLAYALPLLQRLASLSLLFWMCTFAVLTILKRA